MELNDVANCMSTLASLLLGGGRGKNRDIEIAAAAGLGDDEEAKRVIERRGDSQQYPL